MIPLTPEDFKNFFVALYDHPPFPWQSMLLKRLLTTGKWPDLIDLPTASGKTACIDVSVFALAAGVVTPRRTWFVVDRRIVVDEAFERAQKIAVALKYAVATAGQRRAMEKATAINTVLSSIYKKDSPVLETVGRALLEIGGSQGTPLEVARLRGGVPRELAWAGNPAQPAVLTSTIDQVGSRLLFRGYGVGQHTQPVHAALAANDSLIVLDEAHLAAPFLQTVQAIERFRALPWPEQKPLTPFELVVMSATPPQGMKDPDRFPSADERAEALNHDLLRQRMAATKPTVLAEAKAPKPVKGKTAEPVCDDELVLDAAARTAAYVAAGRRRVGVMVNRIATAQLVQRQLIGSGVNAEVKLLTGRLRPLDRDELLKGLTPKLRSGSDVVLAMPIILVTTQCLEVGADFSFDSLVSECASLDALRQRFGRLARLGTPTDAEGVILVRKKDTRPEEKLDDDKPVDPIYRNALARTWNWLTDGGAKSIEMGIDALAPRIAELDADPERMAKLLGPKLCAPTLLPAYLDLWSQTTKPRPAIEPDVPLFLHGVPPPDETPRVDVNVLWRNDLDLANDNDWSALVASLPPLPGEMLQVPLRVLKAVFGTDRDAGLPDADLEGLTEPGSDDWRKTKRVPDDVPFVLWRGRDDCTRKETLSGLRHEDTLVFPASSKSFADLLADAPLPADVYERAYRLKFGVARELFRTFGQKDQMPGELDEAAERDVRAGRVDDNGKPIFQGATIASYGPGFFHITARSEPSPVDAWESDDDEDASLYTGGALTLDAHTRHVREAVDELLRRIPVLNGVARTLQRAADLHDVGKADTRFQFILSGGRRNSGPLLAKSKSSDRLSEQQAKRLYELSEVPKGFRHELLSVQMVEGLPCPEDRLDALDLELHLIGSHHGQCRPFACVVIDDKSLPIACPSSHGELSITPARRAECPPHRLDSGVADRFWRLTRRYGWWGLAYLEAVLRCADIHASKYAEEKGKA